MVTGKLVGAELLIHGGDLRRPSTVRSGMIVGRGVRLLYLIFRQVRAWSLRSTFRKTTRVYCETLRLIHATR